MKPLLYIFIALISISVHAQDLQQYLVDTRTMIKEEKYQEALERCVWFHEHALEINKAFAGVRLSYALIDWKYLADRYAPAMAALIETRDRKTKQIIDSTGPQELFSDIVALNRTLDETSKSIELFQTLEQKQPQLSKKYWFFIRDLLFSEKRYEIIRNYISDPLKEYENIKAAYLEDTARLKGLQDPSGLIKSYTEHRFIQSSLQLIDLAIANNDMKTAREIQQKARLVLDDKRLRDALPPDTK